MPPVPKRSSQRVRYTPADKQPQIVPAVGAVEVPELGIADPHPLTAAFWESLHASAQSQFYEPSDWWKARMTAEVIEQYLRSSRRSSLVLGEINKMCGELLVTEADRRRNRMEIERESSVPERPAKVSDFYRGSLTGVAG